MIRLNSRLNLHAARPLPSHFIQVLTQHVQAHLLEPVRQIEPHTSPTHLAMLNRVDVQRFVRVQLLGIHGAIILRTYSKSREHLRRKSRISHKFSDPRTSTRILWPLMPGSSLHKGRGKKRQMEQKSRRLLATIV